MDHPKSDHCRRLKRIRKMHSNVRRGSAGADREGPDSPSGRKRDEKYLLMVTQLEVALSGLLLVLLFLVCHKLSAALNSKPGFRATANRSLPSSSPNVVNLPEVESSSTPFSTIKTNRRIESAFDETKSDAPVYSTDTTEVITPIALSEPPEGLLTTEDQAAAFDNLGQQFVEAMTATAQNPASPEYRRRWQEEQELLDDQFAALFGVEAFSQQQSAAILAATQK